uniref:Uncharacterized protein n=1 Tax=Anguilla anguilla TaxID=7936 RepID=A0A0E9QG79_ANGAN
MYFVGINFCHKLGIDTGNPLSTIWSL